MEGPIKSAAGNRRPGDELADLELGQSEVSNRCEGGAQAVEGKPVLIINGKTEDEIIAQIAKIAGDDLPKLGDWSPRSTSIRHAWKQGCTLVKA